MQKKLFDFCIGNPPYQDETLGDNKGYAPPVYNKFLDEAYKVSDTVEMIHPARFLFNAGSTPKAWNEKMLNDPHFKVMHYEETASKIFTNTEIKGGVVISYYDATKNFGAIEVFTPYDELNAILKKIIALHPKSIAEIGISAYAYHFTDMMHTEHPEVKHLQSKGHEYDLKSNIISKLSMLFAEEKPNDGKEYIQILGRENNERVFRYIRRDYISKVKNLDKYKLFISKANGAGNFGEVLSPPILSGPTIGSTETFFSIGLFDTRDEAESLLKHIKTKFARAMLGVLKTTQDLTPDKWKYVPLQDFTSSSDIDWSKSIHEIDQQLYKKYGLSDDEIAFIESNVKEMV